MANIEQRLTRPASCWTARRRTFNGASLALLANNFAMQPRCDRRARDPQPARVTSRTTKVSQRPSGATHARTRDPKSQPARRSPRRLRWAHPRSPGMQSRAEAQHGCIPNQIHSVALPALNIDTSPNRQGSAMQLPPDRRHRHARALLSEPTPHAIETLSGSAAT